MPALSETDIRQVILIDTMRRIREQAGPLGRRAVGATRNSLGRRT